MGFDLDLPERGVSVLKLIHQHGKEKRMPLPNV